ncbi:MULTISPECIES: DUF3540 domain-containing protein [Serratia]|uniref:DUF3540 domain-containing protein n=1 Tax=Serratia TaxID=613 RepID=UPI0012E19B6D
MSELISSASARSAERFSQSTRALRQMHVMPNIIVDQVMADGPGHLYLQQYPELEVITAASCLVSPQPGDRVSAVLYHHQAFVTAILQRQQPDAPLVLNSGNVPLHLLAPALEIHSPERVEIHTGHFSVVARISQWVAQTLHQVVDTLFVQAKHAHRQVENTDEVQARHISQHAEQSLLINSRIGSLNASAVLRIDGGQIHMG